MYPAITFSEQLIPEHTEAPRMNIYKQFYYLNATEKGETYSIPHMSKSIRSFCKVTTVDAYSTCFRLPLFLTNRSLH